MNKEIRQKTLKALRTNSEGAALKEWLEEEIREVNSVTDCNTLDEVFGKKYAVKVLENLFAFLRDDSSKRIKTPNTWV